MHHRTIAGAAGRPVWTWGLVLGVALLAGCGGGSSGPAATTDAATPQALALSRPGDLVSYAQGRLRARETARLAYPGVDYGGAFVGASTAAPPAVTPRSSTAVQEQGVDEPDLLQSDGRTIYALQLQGPALRLNIYERAADGRALPLPALDLPTDGAGSTSSDGMVLGADQRSLAVVSQHVDSTPIDAGCGAVVCPAGLSIAPVWTRPGVGVVRVDVSQPEAAATTARVRIDGWLVDSRRIGDALVVVTRHAPVLPVDRLPASATAAQREAAIAATTAADLLPQQRRNGGAAQPLLSDTDCWLQPANASVRLEFTTITVFDLASPTLAATSRCFAGGTEAVYMSPRHLWLATTRWSYVPWAAGLAYPQDIRTDIHRFAVAGGSVSYRGSGEVPGHLGWDPQQKSYRLGEWGDDLRVLSYTGILGWGSPADAMRSDAPPPSPATLTVLRPVADGSRLEPVATLPNARRPAALGKPGEQIYGVRFAGDRGYLVTFRAVDPLYVLDLADASDPRVAGELEVPGYSDRLFPFDGGLLLGVGREVDASGFMAGVKVALFDVADAARPRLLASHVLGERGSSSALDGSRHGLNWLQLGGTVRLALPVDLAQASGSWTRGVQRFELDLAQRSLRVLPLAAVRNEGGYGAVSSERTLQIGSQLVHLRDGTVSVMDW